jgi:hypothetical protein
MNKEQGGEEAGSHHMAMKAEIRVMLSQAKECLGLPEAERAGKGPLSCSLQRKHVPANTMLSGF